MRTALYARVSSERQEREQTMASQISALRVWAQQQGHELREDHIYTDSAVSGGRLDRPGLDQLRDAAAAAAFDMVAIVSPDRLARRHAYQVLLLEEFRRVGCAVVFLERPITDDPHDQLLLEIQGAIAEYERAVLSERFRRGRLHKARAGIYLSHVAPYGYRYLPKGDAASGQLVINEEEAAMVRLLYGWLIEERMTIRQIMKRLNEGSWVPRSGKQRWSASVVHHILSDPVYTGTAYVNRFRFSPPHKPRRPHALGDAAPTCRHLKPREEWIPIPVPALIDEETAARAQAQLARNAQLSWRHTPKYSYLLRCLLTCGVCGLAMFGVCHKAKGTQPERRYYKCHGKDPIMSAREHRCPRRIIKAEDLDEAVWQHMVQVLSDPAALLAQFAQYTRLTEEGDLPAQAAARDLATRLARIEREDRRLLDAYQADVISLDELAQRRQRVTERRQAVLAQKEEQDRLRQERTHALVVLNDLTAFCGHIQGRLATATFADKQTILQLLIERIIVGDDTLEIRHVFPLRGFDGPPGSADDPLCGLRSDGMGLAALPGAALEVAAGGGDQATVVIGDHQIHPLQAALGWLGEGGHPSPPACKTGRESSPLIRLLDSRALVMSTSLPRSRRRFSGRGSGGARDADW